MYVIQYIGFSNRVFDSLFNASMYLFLLLDLTFVIAKPSNMSCLALFQLHYPISYVVDLSSFSEFGTGSVTLMSSMPRPFCSLLCERHHKSCLVTISHGGQDRTHWLNKRVFKHGRSNRFQDVIQLTECSHLPIV